MLRPNLRKRVTLVNDAVLDDIMDRIGISYIFEGIFIQDDKIGKFSDIDRPQVAIQAADLRP